ncbi:hypothetical protein NIES4073_71020 [Kalymmatonema gypsitolerans NIES-4073]|nr:hypothetical protein NIES4073_71020 [Scytonema sp. NIES-4073]
MVNPQPSGMAPILALFSALGEISAGEGMQLGFEKGWFFNGSGSPSDFT